MHKAPVFSIILFLIFLSACSENGNNLTPVVTPVPDIIWAQAGLDSNSVVSLVRTDNGNILAGTNYGLFTTSDNGVSWIEVNTDFSSTIFTCFYNYAADTLLAGTSADGVFLSPDNGIGWSHIGLQGINVTSIAVVSSGRIFAATRGNGIYVSDNLGGGWEPANPDFTAQTFTSLLVTRNNLLLAGGTGVYVSADNGVHWTLRNRGIGNWPVLSLIEDKAGRIDAGTDNGGFYWTSDQGENWIQSNDGFTNTEITTLALNNSGHIFAGTWRGGVFRSVDDGVKWTPADSGLTIQMVRILYCYDDLLYAGTFKGVFIAASPTITH